jgi:hypothetical protein
MIAYPRRYDDENGTLKIEKVILPVLLDLPWLVGHLDFTTNQFFSVRKTT